MANFNIAYDTGMLLRPRGYIARLTGIVKDGHGNPISRYVRIYRKESRGTVQQATWSNATTGIFDFAVNDNQSREYTVIIRGDIGERHIIYERVMVSE